MEKVRLGIIGVGNMGSGHAQNILDGKCPEIEITAVADRRESPASSVFKCIVCTPLLFSLAAVCRPSL